MKVLVLGLDSLDADRVQDRYEFPSLTLAENARVSLEGLEGVEVHTKVIWPIFLDGRHPHGSTTGSSRVEALSRLARSVGVPERIRRRVGGAMDELGVSDSVGRSVSIDDSFLGRHPTGVPISVPGIGEMAVVDRLRSELTAQLDDEYDGPSAPFWRLCELEHEIKRAATRSALDRTDVVMTHFYALDAVQHVAQTRDEERVEAWYRRYADLVEDFVDIVDDGVVFVVSDHGMEDGLHGPGGKGSYAYAACSEPVGLRDGIGITAVHDLLDQTVERVDADLEDDEGIEAAAARHEHLQDLGYL